VAPIFLINVPITLVIVAYGIRVLPKDGAIDASRGLDIPGAVTLSSAVLLSVLPLTLGREAGWPPWTWLCLVASVPLFAAFVMVEAHRTGSGRAPLFDLEVIRRPAIAWGLWPQALAVATYYGLLFTLAQYLQQGHGYSAMISGLTLVLWVVAFAVPRVLGLLPAHRQRSLPWIGCVILAVAYGAISISMLSDQRPDALLLTLLALGGLGLGTNFSAILVHLTTAATPRYAADISGVFTTMLQIAAATAYRATHLPAAVGDSSTERTHTPARV
jgi:Major Facilitator Superfamily